MRLPAPALCLIFGLTVGACASGGSPASSGAVQTRNPDVITSEELARGAYSNAYDAIRQLRPQMLIPRGGAGSSSLTQQQSYTVRVYVDNVSVGLSRLRDLSVDGIREIRYFNATDATQRFGTGNSAGAIVVTMH